MNNLLCVRVALAAALLAPACASVEAPRLPLAPMGVRETQTRSFENVEAEALMKALIDTLQDGEFTIDRADATLGLVVGTRTTARTVSGGQSALKWTSIAFTYGLAALLPWAKSETVQMEASANVTAVSGGSRVRVTLQRRVLDKNGRVTKAESLADGLVYRDLFEQLERSLFVAEER